MNRYSSFILLPADEFAKYNIIVTVEALGYCFCNYINKIDEALSIVKNVNKNNLKFVLDYYNMQQSNEENADITPTLPIWLMFIHQMMPKSTASQLLQKTDMLFMKIILEI